MRCVFAVGIWLGLGHTVLAQELQINEASYDEVKALEPVIETFQTYAQAAIRSELQIEKARIGQILAGQTLRNRA